MMMTSLIATRLHLELYGFDSVEEWLSETSKLMYLECFDDLSYYDPVLEVDWECNGMSVINEYLDYNLDDILWSTEEIGSGRGIEIIRDAIHRLNMDLDCIKSASLDEDGIILLRTLK